MLNFVVNGGDVFTGDTLFKGSVGGVRAPGSTSFEDLRHSIMDVLMKLPHETRVHPGHTDPTTIGDEWESNAFVRLWRGLDEEGRREPQGRGRGRDARALGARLRRRQQGVGALAGRARRHRARQPRRARLAVHQERRQPCRRGGDRVHAAPGPQVEDVKHSLGRTTRRRSGDGCRTRRRPCPQTG